jgi:hypothetical protein
MKTPAPSILRPPRGATMLLVLMFAIVGGTAVTAWMYLMAARLQQAGAEVSAVQRHIIWWNSAAINQQYAYQYSFQDGATEPSNTALLNSDTWGGSAQDPFSSYSPFRSTNNATSPASYTYPFNNVRYTPTSDGSVFYLRTTGDSDSSQNEHLSYYNYQKSYPATLLGDLLLVHTKPSGAGNTTICANISVNGRVVVYDSTATVSGVKAVECLNLTKTGTNYTLNSAGTASMLPENYNATQKFTAGYGGTSVPTAVLDGSLNVINNSNFTPGSIVDIMTANGGYTNVSAGSAINTSSSPYYVQLQTSSITYPVPTTSPYKYTYTSPFNVVFVNINNTSLGHLRINGSVDQLVLNGQTTTSTYTSAGTMAPVIIWLEQEARDIRLVGENNRPIILVTGNGTGQTLYMGWSGTNVTGSGALRWRMQFITQYRTVYLSPPGVNNVTIYGGIMTNSSILCTDATTTTRFTIQPESSPGTLATLMPRYGWFEPYFMVR